MALLATVRRSNAAHDDDVDAMSQAMVRLRKSGVEYAPSIWR